VVYLVTLLQTAQDGDGVFHRWFADEYLLETALEGGVFFHVLTVFIQRGGTDAVQFATGQRGFEHIAGIHRAFGLAGADDRMDFIDEQHISRFQVGEDRGQVPGFFNDGPRRTPDIDTHFCGNDMRQGCFAQSRRAIEEDMIK